MKTITVSTTTRISFRVPVSKIGVIVHRPAKGKGSYVRKSKHCKRDS